MSYSDFDLQPHHYGYCQEDPSVPTTVGTIGVHPQVRCALESVGVEVESEIGIAISIMSNTFLLSHQVVSF